MCPVQSHHGFDSDQNRQKPCSYGAHSVPKMTGLQIRCQEIYRNGTMTGPTTLDLASLSQEDYVYRRHFAWPAVASIGNQWRSVQ